MHNFKNMNPNTLIFMVWSGFKDYYKKVVSINFLDNFFFRILFIIL